MKRSFIFGIFANIAALMMIVACSEEKPQGENLIPEDAILVAKLDCKSLYDKSLGNGSEEAKKLNAMLSETFTSNLLPAEFNKAFKAALSNPLQAFGLNLNQPIYLSVVMDDLMKETISSYAVFQVSNKAEFIELLDLGKGMTGDSVYKGKLNNGADFYFFGELAENLLSCAVTDDNVVFHVSSQEQKQRGNEGQKALEKLFAQKPSQMKASLQNFLAQQIDAGLWLGVDSVMDEVMPVLKREEPETYIVLEEFLDLYKGMSVSVSLNFENGKTVVKAEVDGSQKFMEMLKKYQTAPTDKYYSKIPANSFCVTNSGISRTIWSDLVNNEQVKPYMKLLAIYGIDASFFSELPGVITTGSVISSDGQVGMSAVVECSRNVFDKVMSLLVQNTGMVESHSDGVYAIVTQEYDYFGFDLGNTVKQTLAYVMYADGAAWIFTPELLSDALADNALNNNLSGKGTKTFNGLNFDLTKLPVDTLEELAVMIDDATGIEFSVNDMLSYLSSIELNVSGADMELRLNMGDQNSSLLGRFISLLANY